MQMTDALKRVYASAPQQSYVETIEVSHPAFSKTFYLTNHPHAWRFRVAGTGLVTFDPIPFQVVLPASNTGGDQELELTLCNVGREMMQEIEAANANPTSPINIVYRVYLDVPDSSAQNDPPISLTIADVACALDTISARASRYDVLNKRFPTILYRPEDFPGLVR